MNLKNILKYRLAAAGGRRKSINCHSWSTGVKYCSVWTITLKMH